MLSGNTSNFNKYCFKTADMNYGILCKTLSISNENVAAIQNVNVDITGAMEPLPAQLSGNWIELTDETLMGETIESDMNETNETTMSVDEITYESDDADDEVRHNIIDIIYYFTVKFETMSSVFIFFCISFLSYLQSDTDSEDYGSSMSQSTFNSRMYSLYHKD